MESKALEVECPFPPNYNQTALDSLPPTAYISPTQKIPREESMLSGFKQFIMRATSSISQLAWSSAEHSAPSLVPSPKISSRRSLRHRWQAGFFRHKSGFSPWEFPQRRGRFLLVAFAIYFFVVLPMNAITVRMNKGQEPAAPRPSLARNV